MTIGKVGIPVAIGVGSDSLGKDGIPEDSAGPSFCSALSLTDNILQGGQTTNKQIIGTANEIQGINLGPTTTNNTSSTSSESFTSSSSTVYMTMRVESFVGSGFAGCTFSDVSPFVSFGNLVAGVGAIPSLGVVIDGVTGSPIASSVTMTPGVYTLEADLDTSGVTAFYYDSQGNSGSLTVKGGYVSGTQTFIAAFANSSDNLNDEITQLLDASGSTAPLGGSGQVPHCGAV